MAVNVYSGAKLAEAAVGNDQLHGVVCVSQGGETPEETSAVRGGRAGVIELKY